MKRVFILLLIAVALIATSVSTYANSVCSLCDGEITDTLDSTSHYSMIEPDEHGSCGYRDMKHFYKRTVHVRTESCSRCGYTSREVIRGDSFCYR